MTRFLLGAERVGMFRAAWSPAVVDEARRNLTADGRLGALAAPDQNLAWPRDPVIAVGDIEVERELTRTDVKDRHVLAAAAAAAASVLVTANPKDFDVAEAAAVGVAIAGARLGLLRVMTETQLQAATDGLTGLSNRRAFENGFLQLRDRSPHASCVIVMADLDLFKTVNDTYGHETGDRALRVFADTLRKAVRSHDLVGRRGGEEFAVALPDCDIAAATEVLERVRLQLQLAIQQAALPSFTASFGMTPGFLSDDLDLLLARADAGLFEAKRAGRDQIVVFSAADLDGASERLHLASEASHDVDPVGLRP